MTQPNYQDRIQVFYDGTCPLCRRSVSWLQTWDHAQRLELVDAFDPGFDPAAAGLDREDLRQSIQVRDWEGNLYAGYEGLLVIGKVLSGWRWWTWLGWCPGIYHLGRLGYRLLASNRYRISKLCGGDRCEK